MRSGECRVCEWRRGAGSRLSEKREDEEAGETDPSPGGPETPARPPALRAHTHTHLLSASQCQSAHGPARRHWYAGCGALPARGAPAGSVPEKNKEHEADGRGVALNLAPPPFTHHSSFKPALTDLGRHRLSLSRRTRHGLGPFSSRFLAGAGRRAGAGATCAARARWWLGVRAGRRACVVPPGPAGR